MGFTFNDFMHQVVQPVEHVITDPFTQATHNIQGATSTVAHSFDNIVNTAGNFFRQFGQFFIISISIIGWG
jgi:hypothetical protein